MSDENSHRNGDFSAVDSDRVIIPFVAFESVQARNERQMKRLWITVILLAVLLFVSNALWLWAFTGYDFEQYDYEQDGSGINIIGDENKEVTYNGTASEDTENDAQERNEGQAHQGKI